jgi:hypothetical protein
LSEIATIIDQERPKKREKRSVKDRKIQYINFVNSQTVPPALEISNRHCQAGLLGSAEDWQMLADLDKQIKLPEVIWSTYLRVDIFLQTTARKFLLIIELTVSWEDHMELANKL